MAKKGTSPTTSDTAKGSPGGTSGTVDTDNPVTSGGTATYDTRTDIISISCSCVVLVKTQSW
jgi:hypothetical protein